MRAKHRDTGKAAGSSIRCKANGAASEASETAPASTGLAGAACGSGSPRSSLRTTLAVNYGFRGVTVL